MSSSDDVCVITDSSEEEVRNSSTSSEYEEMSYSTEEEEIEDRNPHSRTRKKGNSTLSTSPSPPLPLPSISTSTMTDDTALTSPSLERILRQQLAYFEKALSTCLNCPPPGACIKIDERLEEKRKLLLFSQKQLAQRMKRVRTHCSEFLEENRKEGDAEGCSGNVKRHRSENGLSSDENVALEKPAWLEELQCALTASQKLDKSFAATDSHPSSALRMDPSPLLCSPSPKYLLQPPPSVHITGDHKCSISKQYPSFSHPTRSASVHTDRERFCSSAEAELAQGQETGVPPQSRCSRCAEVEVVLQKEGVNSIVPIYSELWRLRQERQRSISLQIEGMTQQIAWQEDLFERLLQQMEKEWRENHEFFLRKCAEMSRIKKDSNSLSEESAGGVEYTSNSSLSLHPRVSLDELREQLSELQELRRELDRLATCKGPKLLSATPSALRKQQQQPPYREEAKGNATPSTHRNTSRDAGGSVLLSSPESFSENKSEDARSEANSTSLIGGTTAGWEPLSPLPVVASLQIEIRLLKQENEKLRKKVEEQKNSSDRWELQYRTACSQLHQRANGSGYIRLEAARILVETRKNEWKRVVKEVLGWEVEEFRPNKVVLVRSSEIPGEPVIRKVFTPPFATPTAIGTPGGEGNTLATSSSASPLLSSFTQPQIQTHQPQFWRMDDLPVPHPEKILASFVLHELGLPSEKSTTKLVEEEENKREVEEEEHKDKNSSHKNEENVCLSSEFEEKEKAVSSSPSVNFPVVMTGPTSPAPIPDPSTPEAAVSNIDEVRDDHSCNEEDTNKTSDTLLSESSSSCSSPRVPADVPSGWAFNPFADVPLSDKTHPSAVFTSTIEGGGEGFEKEKETSSDPDSEGMEGEANKE